MKLICGLGNPGNKYLKTRHNAGFIFVDSLAKKKSAPVFIFDKNFDGFTSEIGIGDEKIIFLKPATFMNLSGHSVLKVKQFYKIENDELCIIYDDVDLPLGTV